MPLMPVMEVPATIGGIRSALVGLFAENIYMMGVAKRLGGGFPNLYRTEVVYRPEPRGQEKWQNAIRLLFNGFGDCEDLATYMAAWYHMRGERAYPWILQNPSGTYHAVIRRGSGKIEDPSRILIAHEQQRYPGTQAWRIPRSEW